MRVQFVGFVIGALMTYAAPIVRGESLSFAGFHRGMDIASLLGRYPRSSHELSPGAGTRPRTSQEDERSWIRETLRSGSGVYVVRIAPAEVHDHLYYVQTDVHAGRIERLWLLFEKPADPGSRGPAIISMESRYPPCNQLLMPLTAKYGKPSPQEPTTEEALESFDYVWAQGDEEMTLQCGRYEGRKTMFAIGLTFRKSAPR